MKSGLALVTALEGFQLPDADPQAILEAEIQYLDGMPYEARCLYFTYLGMCEFEQREPLSPMSWYLEQLSKSGHSDVNPMDKLVAMQLATLTTALEAFHFNHPELH